MDRGASRATVHGVTKSWIRLSDFTYRELYPKSQAAIQLLKVRSTDQQHQHHLGSWLKMQNLRLDLSPTH